MTADVGPGGVAALVVDYNAGALLATCVDDLVAEGVGEVVVVDNASADGSAATVADRPRTRVLALGANLGYGTAANRAADTTAAPYLLVCNPDLRFEAGAVAALVDRMEAEADLGIVGPRLCNPDGTDYATGRPFPSLAVTIGHAFAGLVWKGNPWTRRYLLLDWDHRTPRDVDWASGACLLVRRGAWADLGGFDQRFFLFMEDVDLCWRAHQAGWRVAIEPSATVTHVVGASRAGVPVRSVVHHHRALWRWARLRLRGPKAVLLPLVALALVVRAVAFLALVVVGRRP